MNSRYDGMMVNERFYVSVLINKFDKAVYNHDIPDAVNILKQVNIVDEITRPGNFGSIRFSHR